MKGYNLFDDAMKLLGYTDFDGNIQDTTGLKERAIPVINRILADVGLDIEISKLSEEINTDKNQREALIYGAAMLLALTDGDGEKNRLFAEIYNGKRSMCKNTKSAVRDTLPVTYGV